MCHGYFSMNFAKYLLEEHIFYRIPPGDCFWYLENWTFKLLLLNNFFWLDQCYWCTISDHVLMSTNDPQNFKKYKPLLMFSGLQFYSCIEQFLDRKI